MKLVKFLNFSEVNGGAVTHYGIKTDLWVFCGCCGSLLPNDEEGETFQILDVYDADMEDMIRREMEG